MPMLRAGLTLRHNRPVRDDGSIAHIASGSSPKPINDLPLAMPPGHQGDNNPMEIVQRSFPPLGVVPPLED